MEHARKMVMVPIHQYTPALPNPQLSHLQRLENQMRDVLNAANMDEKNKLDQYQEALRRYLLEQNRQSMQPVPVKIIKPDPVDEIKFENTNFTPEESNIFTGQTKKGYSLSELVAKSVPRSYRAHVTDFINDNDIKFNDEGRFIYQGKVIPHSDVSKLALAHVTRSKNYKLQAKSLPGYNEFNYIIRARPAVWEEWRNN